MKKMTEKMKEWMKEIAMFEKYVSLKEKHPDTIYLFRIGDFYESCEDDAKNTSDLLGITLTRSDIGLRMTSFHYCCLYQYLPKIIRAGYRVNICDAIDI